MMKSGSKLTLVMLVALCAVSSPKRAPQYVPVPLGGEQSLNKPQDSLVDSSVWRGTLQNSSDSKAAFLDPVSSSGAEEIVKNNIPRQLFGALPPFNPRYQQFQNPGFPQFQNPSFRQTPSPGFQQFPDSGFQQIPNSIYPQIYKLDNMIIISSPPPQPCIPQRPIPGNDDLSNRIGLDEPTKCTWAIVACCSPDNSKVRYNCFELLGCPGFFFDNSPCDTKVVEAAANAALNFYRGNNNGSSTDAGATNTV